MTEMKTAQEVFDQWEREGKGDKMAGVHWPRVSPILASMPASSGNYLEIGMGTGLALEYIAQYPFFNGQCYGLDVSNEMVMKCLQRFARVRNVTVVHGDFLTWTPKVEHFAVIFSMEVFYYFPDIQEGLSKAFSLLDEGGELWVLVNYYKENEPSHSWPEDVGTPMQLWSKYQYKNGFKKAGFTGIKQKMLGDIESKDGATLCTYGKKA